MKTREYEDQMLVTKINTNWPASLSLPSMLDVLVYCCLSGAVKCAHIYCDYNFVLVQTYITNYYLLVL